jgi:ribosome production factor 2
MMNQFVDLPLSGLAGEVPFASRLYLLRTVKFEAMIRNAKATTHKGRKVLESRAPKVEETPKQAIFIRGKKTGTLLNNVLKNLYQLKTPLGVMYKRHNDLKPFEDANSLEFFAQKSNASLFAFGLHSKKRPNSLIIGRLFDGHILDMMEWLIMDFKSMDDFKGSKRSIGSKPLFLFNGDAFEHVDDFMKLKNFILDFFHGQQVREIDLAGLDHVISVTAMENIIYFRTYMLRLKKSGTRLPRVELEDMGPRFNFTLGRTRFASAETWGEAIKLPKVLKVSTFNAMSCREIRPYTMFYLIPKLSVFFFQLLAQERKEYKSYIVRRQIWSYSYGTSGFFQTSES